MLDIFRSENVYKNMFKLIILYTYLYNLLKLLKVYQNRRKFDNKFIFYCLNTEKKIKYF